MQGAAKVKPFGLRVPDSLRTYLKHKAVDNKRSLTNEILSRLEESVKADMKNDQPTTA